MHLLVSLIPLLAFHSPFCPLWLSQIAEMTLDILPDVSKQRPVITVGSSVVESFTQEIAMDTGRMSKA